MGGGFGVEFFWERTLLTSTLGQSTQSLSRGENLLKFQACCSSFAEFEEEMESWKKERSNFCSFHLSGSFDCGFVCLEFIN